MAGGRHLVVRPGDSLAAAVVQAGEGDEVWLEAGVHRGQAAVVRQRRLRIRGVGGRAVLQADGRHAEGKALLVVRDGEIEIENLAFRGTRVPDSNGAGIRFERGLLTVRDCHFEDNENGREQLLLMARNTLRNAGPPQGWFVRVHDERLARAPLLRFAHNSYAGPGRGPVGFDDAASGNRRVALVS